jgi:prepilin-type N-terminal cleavage/methylation domain-containing protein
MSNLLELRKMLDIIKKTIRRGSEDSNGITLVEMMAVLVAMAAFASIYTYIIVGAVTSSP